MYVRQYTMFETLHPALLLIYALGAPILAMLTNNPIFLGLSLVSVIFVHGFYYGTRETLKAILWMIPILLVIALINMLTNGRGMTTLFRIDHTPYTLESLCYGVANGTMLLTVLLWFRLFSVLLPNEKFLYLFGKRLPSTALLLSMILKLFPETRHKMQSIQVAQGNVNKGTISDDKMLIKQKINHSMRQISSLLGWSMEDSIETADSMKARGYGNQKRTSYAAYHFSMRDAMILILYLASMGICIYCFLAGSGKFEYFPKMNMQVENGIEIGIASVMYLMFLLSPLWMEIRISERREHTWK